VSLLVPALVLAAIVAAACGGGGSKTVNLPGGGQVSSSNKVPDNFPSDFPIYSGAKVQGSYTGQSEGISGSVVIWETGDALDKVKSFYNDQFAKDAWKSDSNGEVNDNAYWSGANKDGTKQFYAGASRADNKTTITVTIGDKPKDSSSDGSSSGGSATSTSGSSSASSDKKTSTAEAEDGSSSDSGADKSPTPSPLPPEVKLASDFPKDRVPFPSGARVTSTSSFGSNGSKTYIITLYVKDSPEKVAQFFTDEMPKRGWTDSFTSNTNGEYFVTFTSGDTSGSSGEALTVGAQESETPGYTTVSLSVTLAGA
jgi:hypothetical protein